MGRSLKKGPFIDSKALAKIDDERFRQKDQSKHGQENL